MDSDKRKRLTIPIVTLIVGIVMMSGVGYAALTSTFEVTENSTVGAKLEVKIEDNDLVGGKILKGVKIPYAVNTVNGKKSYSVNFETILKSVPITATDEMNHNKYKITADVSLPKSVDADIVHMYGIIEQKKKETETYEPVNGKEIDNLENLRLNILLYVHDEKITDPSILNIGDITIKLTLSYA